MSLVKLSGRYGPLVLGLLLIGLLASLQTIPLFISYSGLGDWLKPAAALELQQLQWRFALLPRIAVALLAGAALGLSGALLQQGLRNPLAAPETLGIP